MSRIETDRMILMLGTPADRADFIALERDPEVMRFLNGGFAIDGEEPDPTASFLMPRGDGPHVWAARLKQDNGFVGWFCLWPDDTGNAELGYRLRRDRWGQGLATEGGTALMKWGFVERGYQKVSACTMAVNLGSRRVMERLGLRHVRTESFVGEPIAGAEAGEVWYEISRSEWARLND